MKKNSIPKPLVWAVVVICVLPTLFTLTGVDLGSAGEALDPRSVSTLSPEQLNDRVFQSVSGALTHTLLEWSAFSAAIFTVALAFIHSESRAISPRRCSAQRCFAPVRWTPFMLWPPTG